MFWNIFTALCEEKGIKPTPLLKSLGMATGLVTKWKKGGIPDTKSLEILSDYFNVPIDYLLGKSDKKEKTADIYDGLSDVQKQLVELTMQVPESQRELVLAVVKEFVKHELGK